MKQKKTRGSALLLSTILLFVVLGLVVSLSYVTVMEQKMSQKTKSSVGAFYSSESGIEWALNQISQRSGTDSISSIGTVDGDAVKCPPAFGSDACKIYFLDQGGKVLATSATIDQVKAVRSVGTNDKGEVTQRAIEAAVAGTNPWCNVSDIKLTTGTANNGNFGSYKLMYDWAQSNGCSGYHVCSSQEIACFYQTHNTGSLNGWYNSGIRAQDNYIVINDCEGWTSSNSSDRGMNWASSKSSSDPCSNTHQVLCCKE